VNSLDCAKYDGSRSATTLTTYREIARCANIFLPKPRLLLGARVVPEFGARNRTQGLTVMITLGYQAKLLVRAPAQP